MIRAPQFGVYQAAPDFGNFHIQTASFVSCASVYESANIKETEEPSVGPTGMRLARADRPVEFTFERVLHVRFAMTGLLATRPERTGRRAKNPYVGLLLSH